MLNVSVEFSAMQLFVGFGLASLAAILAFRFGVLSGSGVLAAVAIGGLTYGLGGLPWAILLLLFFASSSLLSRAFVPRKREVAANFAKGGRRDWAQVAANGGAGVLALVFAASGWVSIPIAWAAFAGVIATVNSDTWATEMGVLNSRQPFLITSRKRVPAGTSGAVSLLGYLAALAGALLIAVVAAFLLANAALAAKLILVLTLAGLLGSSIDSLLGATLQAIYYCPHCKKETERHPLHYCGTQTTFHRGWSWLNNDWVNFLSSALAGLLAAAIFSIWL
ncbi:MAG: DUF92 domain-containing protein [Anaerolineales bacterium]